ncbi:MAG: hypothetical protein F4037_02525 [Gemmatimonadales bacterium]|nr:hypothetical protein [Gemmatimonadales bacterium]MYK00821.1 hypothetical protein [Candidatus Palauibacter ramosifaciens]
MTHPTSSTSFLHQLHSSFLACILAAILTTGVTPAHAQVTTGQLDALRPRNIGPAVMSGRIVDLAVAESDPIKFYVASATGGVYKTGDNGITLVPVFENEGTHSVGAIALHQRDTSIVWVGTGERANRQSSSWGDGVYKSTDGGGTWTNMGLRDSKHIGRIALHPDDADLVYVAAMGHLWGSNDERGLYRSANGGATWQRILHVDEDTGVVDVALDPEDPGIVYAATYQRQRRPWGFHGGGPGSALYRSSDGGDTWDRLSGPGIARGLPDGILGRIGISIYRSDPRIVYVSVEQGYRYNASTAYTERRAGIYRSDDRGETWEFMSDWNPRPMYASQILVDPSDDQRIYMMNSYSFSDDGGRTFTVPPQSLHGDDRLVWVNPDDSRHVMKADDGGLGISWDRGLSWLYISDLPVSQYYRVQVDMAEPYNVYGGLQDNGSWMGPSETYRMEGIVNSDWRRLGGGDGFVNIPDTTNNYIIYTESQYLGLSRLDIRSGQRTSIRPGNPAGNIAGRRNWETWREVGTFEEQRLGNAMEPANWDGPFIISPHDGSTLYAGTRTMWKTTDQGDSWQALGDLTTGVDRRTLPVMGQMPNDLTPSLDDGVPYYPTISAVAESALRQGLIYAGTADGRLLVSRDGGERWTDMAARDASDSDEPSALPDFPGLPPGAWVNGIEPSRHEEGRVYAVWNNYRNDDYGNYLYRSDDYGETWVSITGDLPAERVLRTVREDPRNPSVLFLGAEIGLFYTMDGGAHWTEVRGGMPTLPFNDLVIHPRDNDLVLGTHGRGIWILDQINALQELTPEVMASPAHLFTIEPATQIRRAGGAAHAGDVHYRGENPPNGAILDYWLAEEAPDGTVSVAIEDEGGTRVAMLDGTTGQGMSRVVWDMRHEVEAGRGPLVVPGTYTARLQAVGVESARRLSVREDPRIDAPVDVRSAWTTTLLELAEARARVASEGSRIEEALEGIAAEDVGPRAAKLRDLRREFSELASRLARLTGAVEGVVGPLTQDQQSQREFYMEMLETLTREAREAG